MFTYNKHNIGGNITKKDERYILKDNTNLNNLILSNTKLYIRERKHQDMSILAKKKCISLSLALTLAQ